MNFQKSLFLHCSYHCGLIAEIEFFVNFTRKSKTILGTVETLK